MRTPIPEVISAKAPREENNYVWVSSLGEEFLDCFIGAVRVANEYDKLFVNHIQRPFPNLLAEASQSSRTAKEYFLHRLLLVPVNVIANTFRPLPFERRPF